MFSKAALLSLALPAAYGAVHESLAGLPHGWSASTKSVSDSDVMTLQVALQYRNVDSIESRLRDVSDPESDNYGKYMELEEMNSIFAPSEKNTRRVKSWLQKSGAKNIVSQGGLISFTTTVGEANKMLDTNFAYYTNGDVTNLQTTQYSIPDSLTDAIDFMSPTVYFSKHKSGKAPITVSKSVERSVEEVDAVTKACAYPAKGFPGGGILLTPKCIQELYSTTGYTPKASSGSNVAFGSFLNESASHADLARFEKAFKIPAHDFKVLKLINGGVNDQNPKTEADGEANLDVQNIAGLVGDLPIGEYITGGTAPFHPDLLQPNQAAASNEPYLQYYTYLLSQPTKDIPWVISNSYGDHENTVPFKYATRVCNMIAMMGMRGKTIFESSGDEGVGAVCRANDGSNAPQFTPQFPDTCPYVTGVGGTQAFPKEKAWVGSSGGFSNYFGPAWYQKQAIANYINNELPKSVYHYYASNKYVNFTGRAFPDVSAHSATPYYYNVINSTIVGNGGTSAASPVLAGVFALLNDVRFRAGKPALGFINPLIYSPNFAKGFNDITTGGSKGCDGTDIQSGQKVKGAGIIPYASFNATPGWDPVTGLGTPNFAQMKNLVNGAYD